MRLTQSFKFICLGSVAITLSACGGSGGSTTDELDRNAALERLEAAQMDVERIAGDPFFNEEGLAPVATADLPTNLSTTYTGVGYLDYFQQTEEGNTITRETVTGILGDASVTVAFGANPGDAEVSGSVTNLIAGRGTSLANAEAENVAGAITLTNDNDNGSVLSADYSFDLTAFGRGFSANGPARGDVVQDGTGTAIRLADYARGVNSDLPNLFYDLVIVAED